MAQKRGLNRSILAMGWGLFLVYLTQKCLQYGTRLVLVSAAFSSQECAACGQVDAASRPLQARFCCTSCGHEDHADLNAAKVIQKPSPSGRGWFT